MRRPLRGPTLRPQARPQQRPPALPKLRAVGKAEAPALAPSNAPPARAAILLPLAGIVCVLASDLPTPAAKAPPAPAARPMAAGIATSGATTAPTAPPNTSNAPVSASKGVMLAVSAAACSATNCSMSWAACPLHLLRSLPSLLDDALRVCWAADDLREHPLLHCVRRSGGIPEAKVLRSLAHSTGAGSNDSRQPSCSGLADAAAEAVAGLAWIWRPRQIEAVSPVSFVLRVCVEPRLQKTGALQMRERSALIAIVGGFEVVLDGRSQLCAALDFRPTAPWIAGIRPGRSGWIAAAITPLSQHLYCT